MDENQMSEELFPSQVDDIDQQHDQTNLNKSSSPNSSQNNTDGNGDKSRVDVDEDLTQYSPKDSEAEDLMETDSHSEQSLDNSEKQNEIRDSNSEPVITAFEDETDTENTDLSDGMTMAMAVTDEDDDKEELGESELENSEVMVTEDIEQNSEVPLENSDAFQSPETEAENSENPESEINNVVEITEQNNGDYAPSDEDEDTPKRLNQLPLGKVKKIMKIGLVDETVKIVSAESAFLVTYATELFVAALAQEASKITQTKKKKMISIEHLIDTVRETEIFAFLEGTMVPDYNL